MFTACSQTGKATGLPVGRVLLTKEHYLLRDDGFSYLSDRPVPRREHLFSYLGISCSPAPTKNSRPLSFQLLFSETLGSGAVVLNLSFPRSYSSTYWYKVRLIRNTFVCKAVHQACAVWVGGTAVSTALRQEDLNSGRMCFFELLLKLRHLQSTR